MLNFRFERVPAARFTQAARMYRGRAAMRMDSAFPSFDGDVFLHHQLGFLSPKS
jgi:hypothetical protein